VARWLAGRRAPRLVLASRRGITAAGAAGLAARLCGAGSAVTVTACDTGDRADLAGMWGRLTSAGVRVRGVVHTAGVGHFVPLGEMSLAELGRVCAGKVAGAAVLDELAGDQAEAFVMFSSGSATWGSGRQAGYAAANAALDAIAADRRARGLAGTSVAWGLWDGAGMGRGVEGLLDRQGLRPMAPRLAVAALARAVDGGDASVTVADMDWGRFAPVFTIARPSPLLSWRRPRHRQCRWRGEGCWRGGWPGWARARSWTWCWGWCASRPQWCWGTSRLGRSVRGRCSAIWGSTR
jgi:hypothetical protein